jgi:hypothetical protein
MAIITGTAVGFAVGNDPGDPLEGIDDVLPCDGSIIDEFPQELKR